MQFTIKIKNFFLHRERLIIKYLYLYSKDPSHPAIWHAAGVPMNKFVIFLALKRALSSSDEYRWLTVSHIQEYIGYALDDGYIKLDSSYNLKITSKGKKFVSKYYYWRKIIGLLQTPFISIPVIAFLAVNFAFLLGYRIDAANLYGFTAIRRPEFNYYYNEALNGFTVSFSQRDIEVNEVNWFLPFDGRKRSVEIVGDVDPFVIKIDDVVKILLERAVSLAVTSNLDYSRNELISGINCSVLPSLSREGIMIAAEVFYFNNGSNEIHGTYDIITIKGLGGGAPKTLVKRNVSREEWTNLVEQEVQIEEYLKYIVENRQRHVDDSGQCISNNRYIIDSSLWW